MLFELMEYAVSKYGFINSMLIFLWFIFFISFVGVYLSYKNFNAKCSIGPAVITGYHNCEGEPCKVYVRLLDVDDKSNYACRTFDGNQKDNPVGTKIDVAYLKLRSGDYDIRGIKHTGKIENGIFFVLQLLPLLALIGLNVYSIFIDPSFQMV